MLPLSVNTPLESLVCNAQGCNLNTYLLLKQLFKASAFNQKSDIDFGI